MATIQFLLIFQYPLLSHVAIISAVPALKLTSLGLLILGLFLDGIAQLQIRSWLIASMALVLVALITVLGSLDWLIYLTPIVVPLSLLVVFGSTLRPEKVPLVTAIGEKARGPLSESMRRFTRSVTWLWTLVFLLMTVQAIVLLLFSSDHWWSWQVNIINPVIVAVIFVAEYYYRKYRFPDHPHPGFIDYLRIVKQNQR